MAIVSILADAVEIAVEFLNAFFIICIKHYHVQNEYISLQFR